MNSRNILLRYGAALAFLAVAAGAFGAHALKGRLSVEALDWYRTAVLYQFFHALALLSLAAIAASAAYQRILRAGQLQFAGVIVFSGSLYALALGAPRALGMVTPVGGVLMLAGWLTLFFVSMRTQSN